MQDTDTDYQEIDQVPLFMKETFMVLIFYMHQNVSPLYVFEDKRCYKRIPIFYKNKAQFVDKLSRRTFFGIQQFHVDQRTGTMFVQLNPDEDKY